MYTFLFLFIAIGFGQFDWSEDGVPARQGVHIEWQRTGDVGNNGEMIFCWSDTRSGGRDIYANKIDKNGNSLWSEDGVVVASAEGRQEDPLLVSDGSGGAYLIWVDYRDEPDAGDIYGQHILSDGSPSWGLSGIALSNVPGQQVSPNLCVDGNGGAFSIWVDKSASSTGQIYATHLSQGGPLYPGTGLAVVTNDAEHTTISLERSGVGGAAMIWTDNRDVNNLDIYAKRLYLNSSNEIETSWGDDGGLPICMAEGEQSFPKITYFTDEKNIFVWEDHREGIEGNIYSQIISLDGNLIYEQNGSKICDNSSSQIKPRVKASPQGAVVVWEDDRNGQSDIYAQKLLEDGSIQWGTGGTEVSIYDGSQGQPRLTVDSSGGAYVVWMDSRNDEYPEIEIYAEYLDSSGNNIGGENILICDAGYYQFNPLVRFDGEDGAFIVWGDQRSGSIGIYSQHINPSGSISFAEDGYEFYFGLDGNAFNPKTLSIGPEESLLYWEDQRFGNFSTKTFGSLIAPSFYDEDLNGSRLSDNLDQVNAKAELIGDNIFLGFDNELGEVSQYYQVLDKNLNLIGEQEGTAVFESGTSQKDAILVVSNDGFLYYVFADLRSFIDYDIYVQKYSEDGVASWPEPVVVVDNFLADDKPVAAVSGENGGIVIAYNSGDFTGTKIYATGVDENGNTTFDTALCSEDSQQEIESAIKTDEGVFIIFTDLRSGSSDIYGQLIGFDGSILADASGFVITDSQNDQRNSSMVLVDPGTALLCWEDFQNGNDYDISCNDLTLATQTLGEEYFLSSTAGNQKDPFLYSDGNGTVLSVWEDSRAGLTYDIYYQQISNGNFVHDDNGIAVCQAEFSQLDPGIVSLSDLDNSFLLYWDDMRSSGKTDLHNVYMQSVTASDVCIANGDVNGDSTTNILDIVSVVQYVLSNLDYNEDQVCACDMNYDGVINILDIVALVQYVLGNG